MSGVSDVGEVRDVALADGPVIRCLLSGDPGAPALVLLHGLGEGAASWDEVTPALAERFRVVALDLRGHGASGWPGDYSYELMRDDVVGVLDALGLGEVVLVGHSMGGALAHVITQTRSDRVAALVLEDAPPPFPREPRPLPDRPPGPLPFDWAVLVAVLAGTDDASMRWWPGLSSVTVPTLVVAGGPTSTTPQDRVHQMAAAVPDCTLVTLPVGHHVHVGDPDGFTAAVLDWLDTDRVANTMPDPVAAQRSSSWPGRWSPVSAGTPADDGSPL